MALQRCAASITDNCWQNNNGYGTYFGRSRSAEDVDVVPQQMHCNRNAGDCLCDEKKLMITISAIRERIE